MRFLIAAVGVNGMRNLCRLLNLNLPELAVHGGNLAKSELRFSGWTSGAKLRWSISVLELVSSLFRFVLSVS